MTKETQIVFQFIPNGYLYILTHPTEQLEQQMGKPVLLSLARKNKEISTEMNFQKCFMIFFLFAA